MKDKLVKTNRKANYYRLRNSGILAAFMLAFSLAAIAPIKVVSTEITKLQAKQRLEEEKDTTPSSEEIVLPNQEL